MCGFVAYPSGKNPETVIRSIGYRGLPEFIGHIEHEGFTFAHIALPFVNLDPKVAIQPVGNDFKGLFVGEIFNYNSDIFETDGQYVHDEFWFGESGFDSFHSFDGFWTYVTVMGDSLFGITDHLGIKPLYYRTDIDAMASEIDVLKLFGKVTIDETFMSNTMKWGYSPDARTPYNEIKQLPPGHYVYQGVVRSYWDWSKVKTGNLYNDMKRSVEARLGGQREVSMLLSGGLDSSIIYGLLKELGRDVTTIHVENQEKDFAHLVSSQLVDVSLDDVSDEEAVRIHQSPVDLGSVKPQIAMARKLRELGFYAVLTGDGADELFCGYDRYKSVFLADKLSFFSFLSKKVTRINNLENKEIPLFYYSIFKNKEHKKIFKNIEYLEDNLPNEIYENLISDKKIDYINFFDTKYWLTNESNYKLDKCSMINSVEARVPFQDINLIKKFFFIPNNLKFSIQNRKFLLKEMNFLPKYVINRPKTGWFSPEKIFLETNLNNIISEFFDETKIKSQNIIDYREIISFFKRFPKENWKIKRQTLTVILFQIWYDKVLRLD